MNQTCPCYYITPCGPMCPCGISPYYSASCKRCCNGGSLEQRRNMAGHLATLIDTVETKQMEELLEVKIGDKVMRVNSDYVFEGTVVSVFKKTSGLIRYVVEDDRGVLFIWNRNNMVKVDGGV